MVDEILSFHDRQWHTEYLLPAEGQWANLVGTWWVLSQQPVARYDPHPHIEVLPGRMGGEPTLMNSRLPVTDIVGAYQRFVDEGNSAVPSG